MRRLARILILLVLVVTLPGSTCMDDKEMTDRHEQALSEEEE